MAAIYILPGGRVEKVSSDHEVSLSVWDGYAVARYRGLTVELVEDPAGLYRPHGDVPDMLRMPWEDPEEFQQALVLYLAARPIV